MRLETAIAAALCRYNGANTTSSNSKEKIKEWISASKPHRHVGLQLKNEHSEYCVHTNMPITNENVRIDTKSCTVEPQGTVDAIIWIKAQTGEKARPEMSTSTYAALPDQLLHLCIFLIPNHVYAVSVSNIYSKVFLIDG